MEHEVSPEVTKNPGGALPDAKVFIGILLTLMIINCSGEVFFLMISNCSGEVFFDD